MHPVRGTLEQAFRKSAQGAYRQALLHDENIERERREEKDEAKANDAEMADFAFAMISIAEADQFRVALDRYDTATVAALQENERRMVLVQERLDGMFAKAHVLPDGRRIFKTTDGLHVFDEHGGELSVDVVMPEEIADERPRWETVKPMIDEREALFKGRQRILDYQSKLDDAREQINAGGMSRQELDDLEVDLKNIVPDAVRAHLDDKKSSSVESACDDMSDLEIQDDMKPISLSHALKPGL